jgi:NitT/TauT family transport system substrate-binding protein
MILKHRAVSQFALALAGGAIAATAATAPLQAATREIVLGYPATLTMLLAPIAAATELGLFEKEGLSIKVVEFKGTSVVLPQVASKTVDLGNVGPEPLVTLKQPGRSPMPVKFFYNGTPGYAWEMIVPEKGPVRTIEDLKGKKVGVQVMTNTHMPVTRVLMKNHGLVEGRDYDFQTIGYSGQALFSLMRGDADAYYIGWNEIANYQAMGAAIRVLPMDPGIKTLFGNGYVAHEDTIKNDPKMLVGFGRALAQATLICQGAPEWCVKAAWKYYPTIKLKEGTEAEILSKSVMVLQAILTSQLPGAQTENLKYGSFTESSWKNLFTILHDGGELPNSNIDASTIYTNELVEQINAFDRVKAAATVARLRSE